MSFFKITELVPQATYQEFGEDSIQFLHPDLIPSLNALREKLGYGLIANNWDSGGTFNFRGYRPDWYKGGAPRSLHRKGMAIDFHGAGVPMKQLCIDIWQLRDWIPENTAFHRIESFEVTARKNRRGEIVSGWCHLDMGGPKPKELVVFMP
jgi:hypothetical protein